MFQYFKRITVVAILVCMVSVQMLAFVAVPKPAQAFWGIGDFNFSTKIADFYDIAKDIGFAALQRIALSFINRYLQRFVDQLLDKYKIRNYLYYSRVLDEYYIKSFIADKINDPDLKQMFKIAQDQLVTIRINPTLDQRTAANTLLKKMKVQTDKLATAQGVITPKVAQNPPANWTPEQKFLAAQQSFIDDPSFLEDRITLNFLAVKNEAEAASDLENENSKGLKASRGPAGPTGAQIALSAIQNPGLFAEQFATSAINKLFDGTYDSSSPWSAFGSSLGNFIFRKLTDSGSGSVMDEYGLNHPADDGNPGTVVEVDKDGDGFPEGLDGNQDGVLNTPGVDVCYHGGIPPKCENSSQIGSSAYFTPFCQSLQQSITATADFLSFLNLHRNLVNGDNFIVDSDASVFSKRAMLASTGIESLNNAIENFHNPDLDDEEMVLGRYSTFISKVVESLIKDGDLDLARSGNGGGGIDNLISNTEKIHGFLILFQRNFGIGVNGQPKCAEGNINNAAQTPTPDLTIPELFPEDPGSAPGCTSTGTGIYSDPPSTSSFPWNQVIIHNSPDITGWSETTKIDQLDMLGNNGLSFVFDAQQTWPDYTPPGWQGPLQYTMWAAAHVDGEWHAAGFIQFWNGRADTGAGILKQWNSDYAYDESRWGPLVCYVPKAGDYMAFFVSAGDARNTSDVTSLAERSDAVIVQLPPNDTGHFVFP